MAWIRNGLRGSANSKTTATTLAVNPTSALAIGEVVVAYVAGINSGSAAGTSAELSIADSQGNVWLRLQETRRTAGVAGDGVVSGIFYSVIANAIGTGDTITLTTAQAGSRSIGLVSYTSTGASSIYAVTAAGANGSGTAPSVTANPGTPGEFLWLGGIARKYDRAGGTSAFPPASWTNDNQTNDGTTGGAATSNVDILPGDRINSEISSATFSATLSNTSEWAASIGVLAQVPVGNVSYAPYKSPNEISAHIHGETSGYLPPGRLDTSSDWGQPVPGGAEPNLIVYNPAADDAPKWVEFSGLVIAADSVPVGSLAGAMSTAAWDGSIAPDWSPLYDAEGKPVILTISGGAGSAVVEGEIPLSIVNGTASLDIDVRLVADGYFVGLDTVTATSSSNSGNQVSVSFGPTTLIFPPLATHSVQFQVKPTNGGAVTIYSTGMTIDVTAAPTVPLSVGGDLSGDTDNATVIGIQGTPVSDGAPAADDVLVFDGAEWVPGPVATLQGAPVSDVAPAMGEVLTYNGTEWIPDTVNSLNGNEVAAPSPDAGDALVWDGGSWVPAPLSGDVTGSVTANTVERIQGRGVSATAPTIGQILVWDGSLWVPDSPAGVGVKASDLLTRFAPLTDHTGNLIVKTNGAVILVEEPNP
jgi:hypothetical protein